MENSLESQAKWYVLHTYSGYESMVEDSLKQLVENNNLQNSIFDLKILTEQTIEERNGKKKVVERKVLPCYMFIKMIYSDQVWYLVTNTRGVTGFVGPQGRPMPLKEDEVRRMQLEKVVVNADFEVGDAISIEAGPLQGFIGKIKKLNEAAQKATVTVEMFGRNTDVEVDYVQLKKLTASLPEDSRE